MFYLCRLLYHKMKIFTILCYFLLFTMIYYYSFL
nr:MAG TPA: hypothetical protein [Caudoviricetes sp.]